MPGVHTKNLSILALSAVLVLGVVLMSGCIQSGAPPSGSGAPSSGPSSGSSGTSGSTGGTGLPVYPGSQVSTQFAMWATITGFSNEYSEVHGYVVNNVSPKDIINWYKSQFPDYTVDNEGTMTAQGQTIASLRLKKGNTIIGVIVFQQEGQTIYFVGKVIEKGEELPAHDTASGEEPLTRYPGSVMLSYSTSGKFPIDYEIEYGTNDAYEKVVNWFKGLTSQGWTITNQEGSSDTQELEMKKGDDEVTIYIGKPGAGRDYTSIHVAYMKYAVPDHDLVNGTDPMERYPGSVMIDYSKTTMNMGGTSGSEIKAEYLTTDSFDKVKQWYLNKLNSMFGGGGQGYSSVSDEGEMIEAGGVYNNKMITVTVEFTKGKTYTEIAIDYTTTETS